jgi:hypothetical protein
MSEVLTTPAGKFSSTLKIAETSPLEPRTVEYKYYAAGVGLLQDGSLRLVRYGKTKAPDGRSSTQEQDD